MDRTSATEIDPGFDPRNWRQHYADVKRRMLTPRSNADPLKNPIAVRPQQQLVVRAPLAPQSEPRARPAPHIPAELPPPAASIEDIMPASRWLAVSPVQPARLILRAAAARHCMGVPDIVGPSHAHVFIPARHEAMWLVRKFTHLTYPQMGRLFNRDHSTVIYGVRQHQRRIDVARAA